LSQNNSNEPTKRTKITEEQPTATNTISKQLTTSAVMPQATASQQPKTANVSQQPTNKLL
jgi:hypothetical protein